tara:strand:+ start:1074 stop:1208 length:135 start_codon:yes stop_codon:yes gene_type:complete
MIKTFSHIKSKGRNRLKIITINIVDNTKFDKPQYYMVFSELLAS